MMVDNISVLMHHHYASDGLSAVKGLGSVKQATSRTAVSPTFVVDVGFWKGPVRKNAGTPS
jgi:hypothetical protein